ncbi:MAG: ABC transporter permease, partial [Rhodospirillales bacterium]|nr:ABC transporter permease [Acetobacter sp.]
MMQNTLLKERPASPGARPSRSARAGRLGQGHDLPVFVSDDDYTTQMKQDIAAAFRRWPLWTRLGWQDIVLRYRRSLLGPLWMTLSLGVMTITLAAVYTDIFHAQGTAYLLYLVAGFWVWNLISALFSEGCQTFIEAEWLIRQTDLPLMIFPLRIVWRNFIIFMHNLLLYLVVVTFSPTPYSWSMLQAIPGLLLILLNGVWVTVLLGMLSARFRDLPQVVTSIMQVFFFATPIIWPVSANANLLLVQANPFYSFMELVRAPLVGHTTNLQEWLVAGGMTLAGFI